MHLPKPNFRRILDTHLPDMNASMRRSNVKLFGPMMADNVNIYSRRKQSEKIESHHHKQAASKQLGTGGSEGKNRFSSQDNWRWKSWCDMQVLLLVLYILFMDKCNHSKDQMFHTPCNCSDCIEIIQQIDLHQHTRHITTDKVMHAQILLLHHNPGNFFFRGHRKIHL